MWKFSIMISYTHDNSTFTNSNWKQKVNSETKCWESKANHTEGEK